jgi:FkbM family methyltransferase
VALHQTLGYYLALRLPFLRARQFPFRWGGLDFWARPIDVNALEEVVLDREYAFAVRLVAEASGAPTVIDAGANIGLFALAVLQARPDATVHSIEPGSGTAEVLRRNVQANAGLHWHAHHLALWKTTGVLRFGTTTFSTASRIYELAPEGRVEEVQSTTLSEFVARHVPGEIALLKLDIEGAEEAVLVESQGVLGRVEHLLVEVHPPRSDADTVRDVLRASFPYVHRLAWPRSTKPFMFASRTCASVPR